MSLPRIDLPTVVCLTLFFASPVLSYVDAEKEFPPIQANAEAKFNRLAPPGPDEFPGIQANVEQEFPSIQANAEQQFNGI